MTGKFNISDIDQRAKDVADAIALHVIGYIDGMCPMTWGQAVYSEKLALRNYIRNQSFLIANAMRTSGRDVTPADVGRYTPGDAITIYRQRQKPHRLTERETVKVPAIYLGTNVKGKPVVRRSGMKAHEVLNSFAEIAP